MREARYPRSKTFLETWLKTKNSAINSRYAKHTNGTVNKYRRHKCLSEVSLKKSSTPQLKHLKVAIDMKNLVLIDAGKDASFMLSKQHRWRMHLCGM